MYKEWMWMNIMDTWFTIEKIDNSTYAISEYGHWEKVHSYLLIGEESACLIDTGLGIGNIKEITDSMTNLPIKVITTHVHWDHIGGHKYYEDIYVHKEDSKWIEEGIPIPTNVIKSYVVKLPITKPFPENFDINKYTIYRRKASHVIEDGYVVNLGNRELHIIHTPGHSPGHICIYDKSRGYLFTGDLVYRGTLFAFYPSTDPIEFSKSVNKINCIEGINKVLPSHNDLNIDMEFIKKVSDAFKELELKKLLKQGTGIHDFDDFKIQL